MLDHSLDAKTLLILVGSIEMFMKATFLKMTMLMACMNEEDTVAILYKKDLELSRRLQHIEWIL